MSIWCYQTSTPGTLGILHYNGITTTNGQGVYIDSSNLIHILQGGQGDATSTGTITNNTWQNIVAGNDGSNLFCYLNGVQVYFHVVAAPFAATSKYTMFIDAGNEGSSSHQFLGRLADAAIWNAGLTASQAAALAAGVRPYRIQRANLVGYWPLEGTASPEPDVINGNNGTLTGTSAAANPFNYTTPKYGSRSLNGTTDRIDCGTGIAHYTTQATLSAWINFNGSANAFNTVISLDPPSGSYFQFHATSANKMSWWMHANGGNLSINPGTAVLTTGVWYHVLQTCRADNVLRTFINGVSDGTATPGGALDALTGTPKLTIGWDEQGPTPFPGLIADACYWTVGLSDAQIAMLARGFRPHQVQLSGMAAYLPLAGTASPEPDLYAGNNGVLTGTSAGAIPNKANIFQDVVGA